LAATVGEYISRDADGSGIPEMKVILAGTNIYKFLSFQTVIAKYIGLFFGYCGGLLIGKIGPFVHISAGIANKLSKLSIFHSINENTTMKKSLLAASVGAGVAASFGTPVGGVLFSIEVTSTFYMVSNLWRGFFCSVVTIIGFKLFNQLGLIEPWTIVQLDTIPIDIQYIFYVILGVLCGMLGSLFIQMVTKIVYLRARERKPIISK
jgi:chloride channel 2